VFIGYLVLAKAAKQSWRRPNDTQSATSNRNTHDPVTRGLHRQHLVHPQFVRLWVWEQSRLHVLEPTFFANGAEGGGVRERALGSQTHPLLAHRGAWRRRAGRGGSAPP
jgi:hypothetical protein